MKKKKKIIIIIISVVLVLALLLCASGALLVFGLYKYTDVLDFLIPAKAVTSEDVDFEYQETLNGLYITDESDVERARVLYGAILSNESLTNEEKKELTKFMQYFADNKYIDCDRVSYKLSSFIIAPNDPSLIEQGISAEYLEENKITFATDEDRAWALPHELHHSIESEELPYELYGWYGEGFTCLVSYEYFGTEEDNVNLQTFFVRGLGEIVGSDILFEVSATGNMDILIDELMARGIDEATIISAFDLFMQLKDEDSDIENMMSSERKYEAVSTLLYMYNIAYDYPDEISASFYHAAEIYMGLAVDPPEHFYLNSTNKLLFNQTEYVTPLDFEVLYNDSCNAVF